MEKTLMAKVISLAAACLFIGGCCPMTQQVEYQPEPAPVSAPAVAAIAPAAGHSVLRTFPCSNQATDVLLLEKSGPEEIYQGEVFEYSVRVQNLADCTLTDVRVVDSMSPNLQFVSAEPQTTSGASAEKLVWVVDQLAAGEVLTFKVKARAVGTGAATNCVDVTYRSKICLESRIVKPDLSITKSAPEKAIVGETIPYKIVVANVGTGLARDIRVIDRLPEGLTTLDGRTAIQSEAFSLGEGESRTLAFSARASKPGKFVNQALARNEAGLTAQDDCTTVVGQPVLEVVKTAPAQQYIGRNIEYEILVKNTGDAVADNLIVTDSLPPEVSFIAADNGGMFEGGAIVWRLPALRPGAGVKLGASVKCLNIGEATNRVVADARGAERAGAQAVTKIRGVAAMLLEVLDVVDPVEVGEMTTYIVTATNQGSALATDVRIICEIEESQQFVQATGDSGVESSDNGAVVFAPVNVQPGGKAVWRVQVKALEADDVRFKVQMNSEQLGRPVQESEATTQY